VKIAIATGIPQVDCLFLQVPAVLRSAQTVWAGFMVLPAPATKLEELQKKPFAIVIPSFSREAWAELLGLELVAPEGTPMALYGPPRTSMYFPFAGPGDVWPFPGKGVGKEKYEFQAGRRFSA
jgi:hypothetical protein